MKNKELLINKIESIQSKLKVMNFHIGVNDREKSYEILDTISTLILEVLTMINRD